MTKAVAAGWTVSMLTLTQRHHAKQGLEKLWDSLTYAWGCVASGSGWMDFKQQLGLHGFVRSVEVTHGRNGWHVHCHIAVFTEKNPADTVVQHYRTDESGRRVLASEETPAEFIAARWSRALARKGVDFIADKGGLDWQVAKPGDERALGDYVAKLGHVSYAAARVATRTSAEATLGQFKKARRGNRTPFQILQDIADNPDESAADIGLWLEFERVSNGRRSLSWSQGLREEIEAQPVELEAEDEAEEPQEPVGDIAVFDSGVWLDIVYGIAARLLDIVEKDGPAGVYEYLDTHEIPYWRSRAQGEPPPSEA